MMQKILFIAPLPPPVTGHSLASEVLLRRLRADCDVNVVDLSIGSAHDGSVTFRRVREVLLALWRVWVAQGRSVRIYLTISESLAGNLKDLLIYVLCFRKLGSTYIHLHGGSIGKLLFERRPWTRALNGVFVRRLAGVVVTGPSHVPCFAGLIDPRRIHTIPNFAEDYVFSSTEEIAAKFAQVERVNVLFLSGMTELKGYRILLEAYRALEPTVRQVVSLEFAGKFESAKERREFEEAISGVEGITYHGVAGPQLKRKLLSQAHIFCLPTAHLEGQPVSILEAYAAGCVVLCTGPGGIKDVFSDGVNGFEITRSPEQLARVLGRVVSQARSLVHVAQRNRATAASEFTVVAYQERLRALLAGALPGSC